MAPSNAATQPLSPRLEDYLETVARLSTEHGHAHVRGIACARSVTMATVSQAIRRLADLRLVEQQSWGTVRLTGRGRSEAESILRRYELLHEFFIEVLGLPEEIAEREARTMEHTLAPLTLARIEELVVCVKECLRSKRLRRGCVARLRRQRAD